MRDTLFDHLSSTDQLTECQHGFHPRRPCATQLITTLKDWTQQMEEGEPVDVSYLDY